MREPQERFCPAGDLRICFETFGRPEDPAVLLIMGLGTQLLGWHEDLCAELADRDRFVIRFDNRDCGRSSWLDGEPAPAWWRLAGRRFGPLPYSLDALAADAAALLVHLGIDRAAIVGASMGGMVAQTLAINHPDRVESLVSIMAGTGGRRSGQPALRLWPRLLRPLPTDRGGYVEDGLAALRLIGSPGFDRDEAELRDLLELSHRRGINPSGTRRQLAAVLAAGDRTEALRAVEAPAVVIHGTADRLVAPSGGRATAAAIPSARLELIEGMGHDLPRDVWPRIIDAIVAPVAA